MVKVQHANKFALPDVSIATRGNYVDSLESAAIPFLIFFPKAFARLSSHTTPGLHTTLHLQTTIKGWWWLSKRTTTLWDYSGRRNRFLRITYICPDEQKVSTIEAEGT